MAYPTTKPEDATELTWEIAQLFPAQGHWSEEEYLSLDTNHLIEFSHGQLEVLPMPTFSHQRLVAFLYQLLKGFIEERSGTEGTRAAKQSSSPGVVMFAPLRIQLWSGKYREPDLVFMAAEHADRLGEQFWHGADLVMEVVSPDDPERDKVTKRREYAQAGIPEYWIVDPTDASITVLTFGSSTKGHEGTAFAEGQSMGHSIAQRFAQYALHGAFGAGESASSVLLEGFKVDVSDVFSQARTPIHEGTRRGAKERQQHLPYGKA